MEIGKVHLSNITIIFFLFEPYLSGLPVGNHQSRGVSPPFTTGQPGGRSAYPEGQGDMQRFLEDVEASGKPRYTSY